MLNRYSLYKDSSIGWIGQAPHHWFIKPMKHLVVCNVNSLAENTDDNYLLEYIDIGSVTLEKGIAITQKLTFKESPSRARRIVKKNDVIISTVRTYLKAIARINSNDSNLIASTGFAVLSAGKEVDSGFLYYYCISDGFISEVHSISRGVSYPSITSTDLLNLSLCVPPLQEQSKIAKYLDYKTAQIEKLITDKEKLINLLNEERTSVINQAVTKGVNPNERMKDSGVEGLGEIPGNWGVKKLKHIAHINPSTKTYALTERQEEYVVFLPMEKVSEEGDISQDVRRKTSDVISGFTYFERDDVIVAKITPCFENGKGALLSNLETDYGFGSTEFHTIRAAETVTKEFIYYITKSERFMTFGEAFMSGAAGQKRVPTSFLKEFKIGVPEIEEQKTIVDHIKTECGNIDSILAKILKEIELLKEYKTALISEVVTGKIDVWNEVLTDLTELA